MTSVILPCSKDRVPTSAVEFLDIEENACGEDLMSYRCPQCGEVHKSIVIASSSIWETE